VASEIVVTELLRTIREANWKPSLCLDHLPTEFEDVTFPTEPVTMGVQSVGSFQTGINTCIRNSIRFVKL
jgi:hypothetical protein